MENTQSPLASNDGLGVNYSPSPTCVDAVAKAQQEGNGYVCDCFLSGRDGESLFIVNAGEIKPTLLGYAIVPRERYRELLIRAGEDASGI